MKNFTEYVAAGLRYAKKESGVDLPEKAILLMYEEDSGGRETILGVPVFCSNLMRYDIEILLPWDHTIQERKFQKAFLEYQETYDYEKG